MSDGYDRGEREDRGDSRLQTIHMQMRDSIKRKEQGLNDGYDGNEREVGREGVVGVTDMTVQMV